MGIGCLFGHDGRDGVYNAGLVVGRCSRCHRYVISTRGGRWYDLPPGVTVTWRPAGSHAAAAGELLRRARNHAPLLHRLRPKHKVMVRY